MKLHVKITWRTMLAKKRKTCVRDLCNGRTKRKLQGSQTYVDDELGSGRVVPNVPGQHMAWEMNILTIEERVSGSMNEKLNGGEQ